MTSEAARRSSGGCDPTALAKLGGVAIAATVAVTAAAAVGALAAWSVGGVVVGLVALALR